LFLLGAPSADGRDGVSHILAMEGNDNDTRLSRRGYRNRYTDSVYDL